MYLDICFSLKYLKISEIIVFQAIHRYLQRYLKRENINQISQYMSDIVKYAKYLKISDFGHI